MTVFDEDCTSNSMIVIDFEVILYADVQRLLIDVLHACVVWPRTVTMTNMSDWFKLFVTRVEFI